MESVDVFSWVYVKIAQAFLAAIPVDKKRTKHDVIQHLAFTGGVTLEWDGESADATLKGTWTCMLQAQAVFSQYFLSLKPSNSSACVVTTENQKCAAVICIPQDVHKKTLKAELSSLALLANPVEVRSIPSRYKGLSLEENEVYVNITLSSLPFTILNSSEENVPSENLLPIERSCNEQPECHSDVKENKVIKYCDTQLPVENKQDCVQEISSDSSKDVSQRLFNNSECVEVRSINTVETLCEISEHSSRSDCKCVVPVNEQVLTEYQNPQTDNGSKTELKTVNESESAVEKDKHVPEIVPRNTSPALCSAENVVNECIEVSTGEEIQSVKPVTDKTQKKKNYEELAPFKFFCSICSFKSKRESHYQRHLQLHSQGSQLFACEKCNFKTIRLGHLRRHELSHSSTTLACNLCHYQTTNHKLLAKHKRVKHNKTQGNAETEDVLHCKDCDYSTNKKHFLLRHERVHGLGAIIKPLHSYQCDQCQYKTSRREHLVRHTSNVHGGQRPFLCHHCGKAFKRQDALKQHSATHVTQAVVSCPVCGKGCRSSVHLTQHLAVHSSVRSFLCELCGSAFKTRTVQRKHILTIHQHPKAFFCHHCSRKFNTKYALRRHIKQHSTEKKSKSEVRYKAPRLVASITPGMAPDMFSASMRMLQADAIFIQDPPRNHMPDNPTAAAMQESTGHFEGEKITVQLAEGYDPEALRVIPSHNYTQHSNETATALLYLTGNFAPY